MKDLKMLTRQLPPVLSARWPSASILHSDLPIRKALTLLLSIAIGYVVWHLPPPTSLDDSSMHFLGTLTATIVLLILDEFDEYLVVLTMALVWIVTGIVKPDLALAGFSKSSWFFVVGALGIASALIQSGLIHRVLNYILRRFSAATLSLYTFIFIISGVIATAMIPTSKARIAIAAPVSKTLADMMGFQDRSKGSAGLTLAAYVGFSQWAFVFLTGATPCLIGWNLLPASARAGFGWSTWVLAALPAGLITFLILFIGMRILFSPDQNQKPPSHDAILQRLDQLHPLSSAEYVCLLVLILTFAGWLSKPVHGVKEEWIALAGFLLLLATNVLTRQQLRSQIDWGFLLFLGVIANMDNVMHSLSIDRWLMTLIDPLLHYFATQQLLFLFVISLLVYFVRFFLGKIPTVTMLSALGIPALGVQSGIHPGVVLLTILMSIEGWFLLYQNDAYQIVYSSTNGRSFSHGQARKLMVFRFLATFASIAASIPYWRMLGLIH